MSSAVGGVAVVGAVGPIVVVVVVAAVVVVAGYSRTS